MTEEKKPLSETSPDNNAPGEHETEQIAGDSSFNPLTNRGPSFNYGAIIGAVVSSLGFAAYLYYINIPHLKTESQQAGESLFTTGYVFVTALKFLVTLAFFTGLGQVIWRGLFYPVRKRDTKAGMDEERIIVANQVGSSGSDPKIDQNTLVSLTNTTTAKQEGIRWQGWMLGLLGILFLSFATPYIELYQMATLIAIHHLPTGPLAINFLLILFINGLLAGAYNSRFIRKYLGLRRSDLLTFFAMTMSTAAIPGYYLMDYLVPTLLAGRQYNDDKLNDYVFVYLDKNRGKGFFQLTPRDPERPDKMDYVKVDDYLSKTKNYFGPGNALPGHEEKTRRDEIEKAVEKVKKTTRNPMLLDKRILRAKVGAVNKWEGNVRRLLSMGKLPQMTSDAYLTPNYYKALSAWQAAGSKGTPPAKLKYVDIVRYLSSLSDWLSPDTSEIGRLAGTPEESDYFRTLILVWRESALSRRRIADFAKTILPATGLTNYAAQFSESSGSWRNVFADADFPMPPLNTSGKNPAAIRAFIEKNAGAAWDYVKRHPDIVPESLKAETISDTLALTILIHQWTTAHSDALDALLPTSITPPEGVSVSWFSWFDFNKDTAYYNVAARPVEWAYLGIPKGEKSAEYVDENGEKHTLKKTYADSVPGQPNKKKVYWSRLPWISAWFKPLLTWFIFIFAMWGMMVSTMALLRKQWADRERLAFPLAQVPLEMTEGVGTGGVGTFFSNRLAWIGMGIPMLIHSWNAIKDFRQKWPSIPLVNKHVEQKYLTEPPWNRIGTVHISFFPAMIGLTYLVSLEVSFSLWFFWILERVIGMLLAGAGLGKSVDSFTGHAGGIASTFTDQGAGALIAMVLFSFFMARGHLKDALRKAILGKRAADVDDSTEPLSYRVALLMFFISFVVMSLWLVKAGLGFQWAVLLITLFFITVVGLTRLVCEGGLFYIQAQVAPVHIIQGLASPAMIGPQGLTIMNLTHAALMFDLRAMPAPSIMNSFKFAGDGGVNRRHMAAALMVALFASTILGFIGFITLSYKEGISTLETPRGNSWTFVQHPRDDIYGKMKTDNQKIEEYAILKDKYENKLKKWESESASPDYQDGSAIDRKLKNNELSFSELTEDQRKKLSYYQETGDKPAGLSAGQAKPAKVDWARAVSLSIGAVLMVVFMLLRQRIFWWPHPIGYVVWISPDAMRRIIFSIFIGWFVKWAITKYGGLKVYYRMRKFFIGLIVGEAAIAAFWIIIKAILHIRGGYCIHIN